MEGSCMPRKNKLFKRYRLRFIKGDKTMKKIILSILLSTLIITSLCVPTLAADQSSVLDSAINSIKSDDINYINNILGIENAGELPIIAYYQESSYYYCMDYYTPYTFKKITNLTMEEYYLNAKNYIVFSDNVYTVRAETYKHGKLRNYMSIFANEGSVPTVPETDTEVFTINNYHDYIYTNSEKTRLILKYNELIPTFILDLKQNKPLLPDSSTQPIINRIVCFDDPHGENSVFFETNMGNFIRYYSDYKSEAILFTEEKFKEVVSQYWIEAEIKAKNTYEDYDIDKINALYKEAAEDGGVFAGVDALKDAGLIITDLSKVRGDGDPYTLMTFITANNIKLKTNGELNGTLKTPVYKTVLFIALPVAVISAGVTAFVVIRKKKSNKEITA